MRASVHARELITVASSGNVMITNAAVSPAGRLFGNFPRWTDVPTPSVGEAKADGGFRPFPGGEWNEWRPDLPISRRDERISGPNEGSIGPDGYYYFPNSQAPRVNRPYEVFKVKLPGPR